MNIVKGTNFSEGQLQHAAQSPELGEHQLRAFETLPIAAVSCRLIEIAGLDRGGVHLDKVFLNGLRSLRRIEVRNCSSNSIVVRLGSTMGDQLRFQLRNDNLPEHLPIGLKYLATNTVEAQTKLANLVEVNALFDSVGFVRELRLSPNQAKSIIVVFRPEAAHSQVKEPELPGSPLSFPKEGESEHGLSTVSIADGSSLAHTRYKTTHGPEHYGMIKVEGFINLDAEVVDLERLQDSKALQQLSIAFAASCCRSLFSIDSEQVNELLVDWESHCRIGSTYSKDVTIQNISDIELFCKLDDPSGSTLSPNLNAPFCVVDVSTGNVIKPYTTFMVGSQAKRHLRIDFRPAVPGEIDFEFTLENEGHTDNVVLVHLQGTVGHEARENSLRILSGSSLDFGDCCGGAWSQQVVNFVNSSDVPLEVTFGADKGVDVTFRLGTLAADGGRSSVDMDDNSIGANSVEPQNGRPNMPLLPKESVASSSASRTIIHELARISTAAPDAPSSQLDVAPVRTYRAPITLLESRYSPTIDHSTEGSGSSQPSAGEIGDESKNAGTLSTEPSPVVWESHNAVKNGGMYRVTDHLKVFEQQNANRVTDMYAKPGVEYRIIVSYRSPCAVSFEADPDGGRLSKRIFRLLLTHRPWGARGFNTTTAAPERKSVMCKARVCSSFIAVSPSSINFGEIELGSSAKGTISVSNLSEIVARVDLRFISKVLSAYRDEIMIQPGKTVDINIDIVPRRTNPFYQKQVSIHNVLNPRNSGVCLVKAATVDNRGVSLHSLFYRLLTPTGGNFLLFGDVPVQSLAIRSVTIKSTSSKTICLDLSVDHPDDYELLIRKELLLGSTAPVALNGSGTVIPARGSHGLGEFKEQLLEAVLQSAKTKKAKNAVSILSESYLARESVVKLGSSFKSVLVGQRGATRPYGSSMMFRNLLVISSLEYLDLASGPPLDFNHARSNNKLLLSLERIVNTAAKSRPCSVVDTLVTVAGSNRGSNRQDRDHKGRGSAKITQAQLDRKRSKAETFAGSLHLSEAFSSDSSVKLSPALTETKRGMSTKANIIGSKFTLEQVLKELELRTGHPNFAELNTPELEDTYIRNLIILRRAFKKAVVDGELLPVSSVEVPPYAEKTIYVLVHPAGLRNQIGATVRKQEGLIRIRLRELDIASNDLQKQEHPSVLIGNMPVRELALRWTTCRSAMDLGMAHINFGQLEKSNSKTNKILIANTSEIPLLYSIRKSGSIASGDIKLEGGRHGIIAGYGKREVSITFTPHFAGAFEETIHVDNVEDQEQESTVRVKAYILRPPTFSISPTPPATLDFGICKVNGTKTVKFSVTNISTKTRSFTVKAEPSDVRSSKITIDMDLTSSTPIALPSLSSQQEEEVEGVLQKLKISRRKGQPEKEEKYVARLKLLGVPIPAGDPFSTISTSSGGESGENAETAEGAESGTQNTSVAPSSTEGETDTQTASTSCSKVTFTIDPNCRRDVAMRLHPKQLAPASSSPKTSSMAEHEEILEKVTVSSGDISMALDYIARIVL